MPDREYLHWTDANVTHMKTLQRLLMMEQIHKVNNMRNEKLLISQI